MRRGTLGNELVRNIEPLRRSGLDRHAAILLQNRARRAIPANQTPTAATPKKEAPEGASRRNIRVLKPVRAKCPGANLLRGRFFPKPPHTLLKFLTHWCRSVRIKRY